MSCEYVRELISPFLDGKLAGQEREKMSAHLQSCRQCDSSLETAQQLRSTMRTMARTQVPPQLAAQLRVIASHEFHRNKAKATLSGRIRLWLEPVHLFFDNLMRPMALPFAGGLLSALVMFSLLVPNLMFQHGFGDSEGYTSPDGEVVFMTANGTYLPNGTSEQNRKPQAVESILRIDHLNVATPDDANVMEVYIDPNGRVADWKMVHGTLTEDLQSIILLSQFKPATFLGIPTSSKVRIVQRIGSSGARSIRS